MSQPLYLDVRTAAEFATRHLESSINILIDALPSRLQELGSKDRRIIVYCRSGRRSLEAMRILSAAGFVAAENAGSIETVAARLERGASLEPFAHPSAVGGAPPVLTKNEAGWERAFRVIAGLGLLSLTMVGPRTLWGLIGIVPLLTGLTGFCPLYRLLGLSTCKLPRASSAS
jgi:rhodanese-related sulfurtransferase